MKKILNLIGRDQLLFINDITRLSKDLEKIVSNSTFLVIGGAGSIDSVKALSILRGSTVGVAYAEAFQVERIIS